MENIFVPSKGRVKNASFLKLAVQFEQEVIMVLEPQEAAQYREEYPTLPSLILPENDRGITYVRNYIKEYATDRFAHYWQVDDDVTNLYTRQGTKMVKSGFEVFDQARQQFMDNGIALGGLEYQQFAWSATKPMVLDSFCDVCVWVDTRKTAPLIYRQYVEGKEDRDFAMQVIKLGNKTARTTLFGFAAPANGSNAGGLKEIFYGLGKETTCVERMVELWGESICTPITKDSGRRDVKINWKKINSNQASLF